MVLRSVVPHLFAADLLATGQGCVVSKLEGLEMEIRLSVRNPRSDSDSVFGLGVAKLCLGVREKGSLNAAAKGMGMAYSKAWRIIKDTEAALDLQLLNRDGAHGSQLTEAANQLLDAYFKIDSILGSESQRLYTELTSR